MNIERLTLLRDYFSKIPEDHIDMGVWAGKTECGTVCCLAGWAGMMDEFRDLGLKTHYLESRGAVTYDTLTGSVAFAHFFDLEFKMAYSLTHASSYRVPLAEYLEQYDHNMGFYNVTKDMVLARLDEIIAMGSPIPVEAAKTPVKVRELEPA